MAEHVGIGVSRNVRHGAGWCWRRRRAAGAWRRAPAARDPRHLAGEDRVPAFQQLLRRKSRCRAWRAAPAKKFGVADLPGLVTPVRLRPRTKSARQIGRLAAGVAGPAGQRPCRSRYRARRGRDRTAARRRRRGRGRVSGLDDGEDQWLAIAARCSSVPIRLDVQQREGAEDARQVGRRRRMQIGFVELGEIRDARAGRGSGSLRLRAVPASAARRLRRRPPAPSIAGGRCRRGRRP